MFTFARALPVLGMLLLSSAASADTAVTNDPKGKVAVGLLDMAFNQHKVAEAFATYVGPTYKQHNPTAPDGKDAAIKGLSGFVAATPGLHYDIKQVLVDGNLVAVHAHVTMNPTDRGAAVVDIFRLENDKIVEHWDVVQPVPEKSENNNTMF